MAPMRRLLARTSPAEIVSMRAAGMLGGGGEGGVSSGHGPLLRSASSPSSSSSPPLQPQQPRQKAPDLAVTADDLLAALARTKPSVSARDAERHTEWEAGVWTRGGP